MISVIITTFNRPEKVKKAIKSVINQTFEDWELIVVDDHSNERQEWLGDHSKVTYEYLEKNTGKQAIPKNIGTKMSKGEYIAYLDDDNTWRPDHLQILYNEFQKNPQLDLVYGDRWLHDEGGNIPDQIGIFSDYNPQKLLQHNYIDTSDFLVRREAIFNIGGWDERYKRMADWNLIIRLAKNGARMKRVPVIITDYNLGADSISHTPENEKQVVAWNPYELEVCLPNLREVSEPVIDIFTVSHKDDALPIMEKCLPEMYKRMGYPINEHVFVINGDLPKTIDYLKKFAHDNNVELEVIEK